ncbi:MAG: PKD domain-containing protein [Bacteroidetes bacterium]|nr:PKD domain-containing protein [Bacteroidota bacterium]
MIFLNDSIHLFSKNWVNKQTKHYVLPNSPGTHVAQYRETYNTGFLVTSASVQQFGVISLIGYLKTGTQPVSMCLIYDYKNNLLFNGNKRKFDLSTQLVYGQVEGVEFFNSSRAFVTNELFTNGTTVTAKLRTFDITPYLPAAFLYPKPVANFTANNVTVCSNTNLTFTDQSTNSPTSWQWIFTGGTPATSTSQNPQVNYQVAGTYTVKLIVSNSSGSDSLVKTNYITVNPLPAATITAGGATTICLGGSVSLNANTGPGLTYQWKNNTLNIAGATASSFSAIASGDYTCSVSNSCGSVISNSILVSVNSGLATPAITNGPALVCKNTTGNLYSTDVVSGATSYTWTAPTGATIISGQGTNAISIDYSNTAVSGNVCVYASNNCGNSSVVCKAITIATAIPARPASISGSLLQCPGNSGVVYTCQTVSNTSSYIWTVPSNVSILSGQGTNSITVNFQPSFVSGYFKVGAVNCIGTSSLRSIFVTSKPSTPGLISGPVVGICAGTTNVAYTIAAVNTATGYNWIAPPNATMTSGQGTTSVTVSFSALFTSGSLQVTASNICGTSNARSTTVRSAPGTPGTISGIASVCANQTGVPYSIVAVAGAIGYEWIVPVGALIVSGQNSTSIVVNYGTSGGSVKVRANNVCGNSSYRTLTVAVSCRDSYSGPENTFDVSIFPNPANAQFTVRLHSDLDAPVIFILRDPLGREIERMEHLETESDFEFGSNLSIGIYFVEILSNDNSKIIKVIKQE